MAGWGLILVEIWWLPERIGNFEGVQKSGWNCCFWVILTRFLEGKGRRGRRDEGNKQEEEKRRKKMGLVLVLGRIRLRWREGGDGLVSCTCLLFI